jgi:hypothetical protein
VYITNNQGIVVTLTQQRHTLEPGKRINMENKIEKLEEIADEIGGDVRSDYSGRGMFGRTCYGITCNDPNECLEVAGSKRIRGGKIDNMGKRYIVYWPDISDDKDDE